MTSSEPGNPVPSKSDPPPYRGELTRQMLRAHQTGPDAELPTDEATLTRASRGGAQWFYWIAGFSLVNSLSAIFGGHLFFLTGLAVSHSVDLLAKYLGSVGPYVSLGLNLVIAFFFCGFGYLATHGSRAVFLLGIILYRVGWPYLPAPSISTSCRPSTHSCF